MDLLIDPVYLPFIFINDLAELELVGKSTTLRISQPLVFTLQDLKLGVI
jgi:hypothetical protein